MTLRKPAAHLRGVPSWRRSGDESYWENFTAEGEVLPRASSSRRAPRPQSAIEGGRLDSWLEHLQRMQSDFFRDPVHDQVSAFSDRTTTGHAWRQPGIPSSSRDSSSCGSTTLGDSLLGSQESLRSWFSSPPERRGSWERAHIMEAPRTEQTQLSYLAPVKVGWLPIKRRAIVADACSHSQSLDHSAGKVKLKQPITPTFHKNQVTASRHQDEKLERSRTTPSDSGVKTGQTPDQNPPITKQVPEKQSFLANRGDRLVGWQALRRSWNSNRVSAFPRGSQSNEFSTGTSSDPNRTSPLTNTEPLKHSLHQTIPKDPCKPHGLLQETNSAETCKAYTPRTSSVQPVRATVPLCGTNSSSPAVTTIIPQNKAGFSSITISSRKVSRSASLPGVDTFDRFSQSRESPSPPPSHQSMDTNSRKATVQRKATIVKVTEQRMMSGPATSAQRAWTPPADKALDDVVRRRKATIIKVMEQRESYSPARAGSGTRNPEYRHSYTDGVYSKENSIWSRGNNSQQHATSSYHLDSTKRPNASVAPTTSASDAEKNGGTRHKSTMSLVMSTPSAVTASAPSEVSLRAVGRRSDRPLSCYGNVFGHAEASEENATQPAARKWSFGLPEEIGLKPADSDRSFISSPTAVRVREAGQPVTDSPEPNGGDRERLPPENAERRASGLTLIKAADPHSNQSAEDVLALNAAAIIANIKLQRQLSKKKAASGNSETDSSSSPQGKTDEGKCKKPHPDQKSAGCHSQPHAAFVPLSPDPEASPGTFSLQEALQRSRPDFISRSKCRLRELERRKQERREQAESGDPPSAAALRRRGVSGARSTSLNDNLFKLRDRAVTGKATQLRSKRSHTEVKKKQEEEKKREVCLSNRQRVEIFKKKLLDQILHRSSS